MTNSKRKTSTYQFSEKSYKELRDKCQKVLMLLKQSGCEPQFYMRKTLRIYISGVIVDAVFGDTGFWQYQKCQRISPNRKPLRQKYFLCRCRKYWPTFRNRTFFILGGNGAAIRKRQWITSPSSMNWKITKPLFTIRSLPFHYRHNSKRELDKKKKARRSGKQFSIQCHYCGRNPNACFTISPLTDSSSSMPISPSYFPTKTLEKMEDIQSMIENKLFHERNYRFQKCLQSARTLSVSPSGQCHGTSGNTIYLWRQAKLPCVFFLKKVTPWTKNRIFIWDLPTAQGVPLKVDPADLPMKTGRINNRNKFVLGTFRFRENHSWWIKSSNNT